MSGLALVGLIVGAMGVVLAISSQSQSTRSLQVGAVQGRLAAEFAESGIDEALAEFTKSMDMHFGGDARARIAGAAQGGQVPGSALGGDWTFFPARTAALMTKSQTPIQLSPVAVRPLYYNTVSNYGEVDLSCCASFKLAGNRQLFRRVTTRHYFQLVADGKTFLVNPVSNQINVDRSRDE